MRYIFAALLALSTACANDKATKLNYDTCFYGEGTIGSSACKYKLKLTTSNTFQAEEDCVPIDDMGFRWDYSGEWQPLENGEILLTAAYGRFFAAAYDSATAKGIRRIDARRYVLNIAADSVSLGKGVWLQRHACSIRLRRK